MRWQGRLWIAGSVLAAGAGIVVANWPAPEAGERSVTSRQPTVVAQQALPLPTAVPATPATPATPAPSDAAAPLPATMPPGVSAEQWAALRAEFAERPAELRRLAEHLTFADELDRFRSDRAGGRSGEQLALARSIDAGLAERLRARELSAAEARLIKIAVLEVLVEDERERHDALGQWEATLAPSALDPERSAALADFQRRQANIVAAWRALPPDRRDAHALERELQALRVSSFDSPQPDAELK